MPLQRVSVLYVPIVLMFFHPLRIAPNVRSREIGDIQHYSRTERKLQASLPEKSNDLLGSDSEPPDHCRNFIVWLFNPE